MEKEDRAGTLKSDGSGCQVIEIDYRKEKDQFLAFSCSSGGLDAVIPKTRSFETSAPLIEKLNYTSK